MNFEENSQQSNMEFGNVAPAEMGNELEKFADAGVEKALNSVRSRFENQENPLNNLAFHNSGHTKRVIGRTDALLEAMGASADVRAVGELGAAFHDTVQEWEAKPNPDGSISRKRFHKQNEETSVREAQSYMDEVNKNEGRIVFGEDHKKMVEDGILATIATGWDKEHSTVAQPNLKEESPLLAKALALADIGGAGMDGPAQYIYEGSALFREENLDILSAMQKPEKLTDEQKENFRKRMLAWSKFQPKFAEGRKARFEMEIAGLPPAAQEKIRQIFNKFDASIRAAQDKASQRESMNFEELARDFGYSF